MAARRLFAAAKFRKQTQDFEVEPDERDHQAEGAVPLHIFRRANADARLDEIKIEHEIERRDNHHKNAEADSDGSRSVDRREMNAEKSEHDFNDVEERDTAGRGDDAETELFSNRNQSRA